VLVGIVAPSLKNTVSFMRIRPFRWSVRGPLVPVVQEAQFSKRLITSTESPSSSSDSDELAALSASAVMAVALVLIAMGPLFVCLTLVVLVLHLYGVTTGFSSSSESVGVRLRPVPPLVFFTPLLGNTFVGGTC
jgi:hypothetical protein